MTTNALTEKGVWDRVFEKAAMDFGDEMGLAVLNCC